MSDRYKLVQLGNRGGMFYYKDTQTGARKSLKTKNRKSAEKAVFHMNKDPRPEGVVLKSGLYKRPRTILVAYDDMFKIGALSHSRTVPSCQAEPLRRKGHALGLQTGAPWQVRLVQRSSFSDRAQSTRFPLLRMKPLRILTRVARSDWPISPSLIPN
jgi:hypothetical protein